MPLNQLATVSVPEPRMISVQVWDRSMVHAVEKAIMAANLGLTPSTEGQVIHLRIPELNEERRKELVKVAHKYAETAKVAVRHVRRDGMDVLKKLEKDHQISEDDHKRMDARGAEGDRPVDRRHRPDACDQGKGDHDGLIRFTMPKQSTIATVRRSKCRGTSPSSWMATAAGRRRAGCRAARAIGAASRRCARPCAPPANSASPYLTIFSFSAENWSRPASEIRDLMGLLRRFIRNDLAELHQNGVKVRVIGERDDLDPDIRRLLEEAEELTQDNDRLTLVVAFNYGARQEIARAARALAAEVEAGRLDPDGDHRRPDRTESRRAGSARSRPHHPHQRRAAAVEFPALAGGLQRTRVRADLLARFRPRRARRRDRRISPPRAPVRRPDRADRILIVAGAHPAKNGRQGLPSWPAAAISSCGSCPRWCWRRSRSPRPISAAGLRRVLGDRGARRAVGMGRAGLRA